MLHEGWGVYGRHDVCPSGFRAAELQEVVA